MDASHEGTKYTGLVDGKERRKTTPNTRQGTIGPDCPQSTCQLMQALRRAPHVAFARVPAHHLPTEDQSGTELTPSCDSPLKAGSIKGRNVVE